MREKPAPKYNIDLNRETGEIYRTDKAERLKQALLLFESMLKKSKRSIFSIPFLAYHLNLEDNEVEEFMSGLGFVPVNEQYEIPNKTETLATLQSQK